MVFSRRMAALAAVVLTPLGIAATSFALTDTPREPRVPAGVELESGSPTPDPASSSPEPTPSDQVVTRPPVTDARPVTGPWTQAEKRCALLLATVVALWCSEPLHHVPPAVVALIGAVVASFPALGTVRLKDALGTVPWSLLLFTAATMAMGVALADSGAARWLVSGLPSHVAPVVFLGVVVAVSTAAHLVLQSRSARSSVLVPLVIAAAVGAGVNPVAAALASTAAAGFCHTLPASAKPVALFAEIPGTPTYTPRDLLRLPAVLAPLTAVLVLLFATAVRPLLGVPVTR